MPHINTIHVNGIRKYTNVKRKLALRDSWGLGVGLKTLEETLVTKSEEAISGYFSWQKLLRKVRVHVGLSSR
jgi:hypothetical protein